MLAVGFGAMLLWFLLKDKKPVYFKYYLLGAVFWTIAILPKYVMDYTITTPFVNTLSSSLPILAVVIIMALYYGLRTGLFESGFTYLILKHTRLSKMNFNEVVALGIGFGGIEAIFIGGQWLSGIGPMLISPLDPTSYLGVWERLFTLFCHVFSVVLVVYAVKLRKQFLLWLSVAYKTMLDGALILFLHFLGNGLNSAYVIEAFVAVMGFIGLIGLYWMSKKYEGDHPKAFPRVNIKNIKSFIIILALISAVTFFLGCASNTATHGPSMDAANVTIDRILDSFNTGNYTEFSANFSSAMISGLNETSFNTLRSGIQSKYGKYVSRSPIPTGGTVQGYNIYLYACHFEKSDVNLQLTMNTTDVWRVEGLYFR